jgi:hypothetical protein
MRGLEFVGDASDFVESSSMTSVRTCLRCSLYTLSDVMLKCGALTDFAHGGDRLLFFLDFLLNSAGGGISMCFEAGLQALIETAWLDSLDA